MVWWHILLIVICSYLSGNISVSRIIAKSKHDDITKRGSGNPGSTNVLRSYGLKWGILNLVLDMLKAIIPCLIVLLVTNNIMLVYIAGLSVTIGHVFPIVFKFKGGKGIATLIGVFSVTNPIATLIVFFVAFLLFLVCKYMSVASFLCITVLCITEGFKAKTLLAPDRWVVLIILFVIAVLTFWSHRSNIKRLILGKENKIDLFNKTKKDIKNNTVQK